MMTKVIETRVDDNGRAYEITLYTWDWMRERVALGLAIPPQMTRSQLYKWFDMA